MKVSLTLKEVKEIISEKFCKDFLISSEDVRIYPITKIFIEDKEATDDNFVFEFMADKNDNQIKCSLKEELSKSKWGKI